MTPARQCRPKTYRQAKGAIDMTTQQTDALQCAADLEYSIARHGMQDAFTLNAYRAMKMVRTQHARITDLEAQLEAIGAGGVSGPLIGQPQAMPDLSQLTERGAKAWAGVDAQGLREGFTAADMATASAQGFRDGVASLTAQAADSVQEDAARLDFLIDQGAYVVSDPDTCTGHWLHWARPDGDTWVQIDKYPTPRAAIDAARKQEEKQ